MGMKLIFVAALSASCAIFLAHSAPTSLTSVNDANSAASSAAVSAEKPLIRTKRAEEILYGNHQNAPRVKKSDPAIATSEDVVSTKNDDVTREDAKTSITDLDEKEKIPVDSEQSLPTEEQEEIPPKNEPLHNVEDIPAELNDADYQRYEDQEGSEDAEALRKKRSIKTVMMTAENMAGSSRSHSSVDSRPVRAKRDLDYEDLRQLFANSREGPYDEQEELENSEGPGGRIYVMEPDQVEEEEDEDSNVGDEDEEEKRSGGGVVPLSVAALRPYEYEPSYEQPSENEELLRELVERKVEEDAREKLLDYLLAAAIASEAESANEAETDANDDADEGIIEDGPGRPDYDDESIRDMVGAEPPVVLKRSDFYPYSYEPYGGRWGAMVPGSKRSANEYERLYRLAEALNADNDYDEK